jgi:probable DNA metabolism protein
MEAFIRFQEGADGLFYAMAEPDFDVLPIIAPHFSSRYADQSWLIYDACRKYGIHHKKDSALVEEVHITFSGSADGHVPESVLARDEPLYQMLWKDYFNSTGIAARKNPKLHIRHMPLRYWRHLTEKKL